MRNFIYRLIKSNDGSITVETAIAGLFLSSIAVGVIDFGLAFAHKMQLANSVRAGMQYALVRKPVNEDYTAIISAINSAAPAASSRTVSVTLACECPDGTSIDCVGEDGEDLTCDDSSLRAAYLNIAIAEDYDLILRYPGLSQTLSFSETAKVRLN